MGDGYGAVRFRLYDVPLRVATFSIGLCMLYVVFWTVFLFLFDAFCGEVPRWCRECSVCRTYGSILKDCTRGKICGIVLIDEVKAGIKQKLYGVYDCSG